MRAVGTCDEYEVGGHGLLQFPVAAILQSNQATRVGFLPDLNSGDRRRCLLGIDLDVSLVWCRFGDCARKDPLPYWRLDLFNIY